MDTPSVPPDCGNPHHSAMATRAVNAEVAAWHLRGWAILLGGLAESRRHSSFGPDGEEAVGMVVSHALDQLAATLEVPDDTPPVESNGAGLHVVRPEPVA